VVEAAFGTGRRSKRRLVLLALAALLVVLLAIVFWPRKRVHLPVVAAAPPVERGEPSPPGLPGPPAATASSARPMPPPPDAPPIIDEIKLEKTEVCSGEENLVSVRAHTVDGTDAFLHYVIDGQMGSSVPLRLWLGEDGEVKGQHFVRVFGRTNTPVTVPLPQYKVLDCQPRRLVAVEPHLRANSWSDFDFVARVVTLPSPTARIRAVGSPDKFVPHSFTWAFGDGETASTTTGVVSHNYEGRAQNSLYSYFTVAVEVHGGAETIVGRASLSLINPAFESFAQKGIVQLLIALDPRFPEVGADGRVVQRVRLWHVHSVPVTLSRATVTRFFETGAGQTKPEEIDVGGLLGAATIPPGKEGITTTVVLDTVADPGVFSVTYRLNGLSQDGHPVAGSFSVMRPPAKPTAENSRRVDDPVLKAKIVAARAILGKDVVTDEDIWALEREGLLSGLVVPPAGSAAAAPVPAAAVPPAQVDPAAVPLRGPPVPSGVTPAPTATMAPGGLRAK